MKDTIYFKAIISVKETESRGNEPPWPRHTLCQWWKLDNDHSDSYCHQLVFIAPVLSTWCHTKNLAASPHNSLVKWVFSFSPFWRCGNNLEVKNNLPRRITKG